MGPVRIETDRARIGREATMSDDQTTAVVERYLIALAKTRPPDR
jgi:hypothetical protein